MGLKFPTLECNEIKKIHFTSRLYWIILILRVDLVYYLLRADLVYYLLRLDL